MSLIERAALFSRAAHQAIDQRRKYTGEPYHKHPEAVAWIVAKNGGTDAMVAAAYLHDVVEDTAITLDMIRDEFGNVVAELVDWLSDMQTAADGNRATRKRREREKLAAAPAMAQTIKLADLIDNTSTIVEHDPDFATVYLAEKRDLLCVMENGDQKLWRKAWSLLVEGEAKIAEIKEARRPVTHRVYINGRRRATVYSEEAAWDVIGQYPLGALYEVRDADDNIRPEFVPY